MDELTLETGHSPEISIESQGKLYIKGWDRAEIRASANGKDNLSLHKDGEKITVQSLSNCEMRVPYASSLLIHSANRETILKSVTGHIKIQQVNASLTLNDVGETFIEMVDRDLNVREVHGNLTIQHAGRFVNASHIAGDFTAEEVGAHLTLKQVEGNLHAHTQGNATLNLNLQPGKTYLVETHGVLTCQINPNANVTVEINGSPIVTKLDGETQTLLDTPHHTFTLGDGSARLELTGYGPVTLLESDTDATTSDDYHFETEIDLEMDTLAQNITQQVHEQIAMQMDMLHAQMDALVDTNSISEEKADRIRRRTEEKVARAQEKIARAQEKAAEKIEMARRKAEKSERKGYPVEYGMDAARTGVREGLAAAKEAVSMALGGLRKPAPPSDPVSDQERMMILNMLAEKKISIEQAEALLAALEGKSK